MPDPPVDPRPDPEPGTPPPSFGRRSPATCSRRSPGPGPGQGRARRTRRGAETRMAMMRMMVRPSASTKTGREKGRVTLNMPRMWMVKRVVPEMARPTTDPGHRLPRRLTTCSLLPRPRSKQVLEILPRWAQNREILFLPLATARRQVSAGRMQRHTPRRNRRQWPQLLTGRL